MVERTSKPRLVAHPVTGFVTLCEAMTYLAGIGQMNADDFRQHMSGLSAASAPRTDLRRLNKTLLWVERQILAAAQAGQIEFEGFLQAEDKTVYPDPVVVPLAFLHRGVWLVPEVNAITRQLDCDYPNKYPRGYVEIIVQAAGLARRIRPRRKPRQLFPSDQVEQWIRQQMRHDTLTTDEADRRRCAKEFGVPIARDRFAELRQIIAPRGRGRPKRSAVQKFRK